MIEYIKLLEFSRPNYIKDLSVSRTHEQGLLKVWLQVTKDEQVENIELSGFNQLAEAISNLLEAERAVISRELNSGKEFGTVKIECWVNECYFEFICDKAELA